MVWFIISWFVYGLLVGLFAKFLHPGDDEPKGCLPTFIIGVLGSFMGGFISYWMGINHSPISTSGLLMSVFGGVVLLTLQKIITDWNKK